jgi:mRNA interferase MazF
MINPSRGEIWTVNLNPAKGHEQAGFRPALVISVDLFNHGPADLVVVAPMTSKDKGIPFHVKIEPSESGLSKTGFIKCEDLRSVSKQRLSNLIGKASPKILDLVEDKLKILLGFL